MPRRALAPWSVADLRRRCLTLREQLEVAAADVVSPAEVAAYWPDGKENPLTQAHSRKGQWIYCYASLVRLCDRLRTVPVDQGDAERARRDAQTDTPVPVVLSTGTTVYVYPKSYVALEFCQTLDRAILRVVALTSEAAGAEDEGSERVLALAPLVRATAVLLWVWVITHPPAELPFPLYGSEDLSPPDWTHQLTGEDLLALWQAHRTVNGRRNALIASLMPDDVQAKTRLSLESFLGAYAHEHGADVAHLMERIALGKLFAQAVSAAQHAASLRPKPASEGVA